MIALSTESTLAFMPAMSSTISLVFISLRPFHFMSASLVLYTAIQFPGVKTAPIRRE